MREGKLPSFLYFISVWEKKEKKKKSEAVGFSIDPEAVVSHPCHSRDFNWNNAWERIILGMVCGLLWQRISMVIPLM